MGITTVFSSKNGSWWYITCLIILELLPNYIITITVEFGLKNSAENIGTHLYLDNLPTSGNHTFHKRKCKAVKMCLDTSGHVLTQLDLTDVVPQIIMHCHRFTLNGSFCMLIYARTCNIFVILTPRSNSGIKKELIAHFSVFLANY